MILMSILAEQESRPTSHQPSPRLRSAGVPRPTSDEVFVSLKDVAGEMGLSMKFLEEIAAALKMAGLIEGRKGPGGGYRLAREAKSISVYEILVALEGPIAGMSCKGTLCPVADKCTSKSLWGFLHEDLIKSLKQTTLQKIVNSA